MLHQPRLSISLGIAQQTLTLVPGEATWFITLGIHNNTDREFRMVGTPLIISAALTTGSILGAGGDNLAANPNAHALTLLILLTALILSTFATYRTATGPVRPPPPPGPSLPRLRRSLNGPRDRRW